MLPTSRNVLRLKIFLNPFNLASRLEDASRSSKLDKLIVSLGSVDDYGNQRRTIYARGKIGLLRPANWEITS